MDGQSSHGRPSPLRNSKAVNRPFQSPLRSVLSPGAKVDYAENRLRNLNLRSTPYNKNLTTPEKRTSCQPKLSLAKKLCQENKDAREETDKERSIDETDIKRIRDRISAKKRELEHMKQQSLYKKMHNSKDLENLIERWLHGCQEALTEFQKDISQNSGTAVNMTEILAQLGIPPNLVRYSIDDGDFA